jgi:hypothetical protein
VNPGSDADGDSLTYIVVTPPTHAASFQAFNDLIGLDSFLYTSDVAYVGTDSFTYKVNDGQADSATVATVTFTLTNNTPQVGPDDNFVVTPDTPFAAQVSAGSDADAIDATQLTYLVVTSPSHGTLSADSFDPQIDRRGFTYTPATGFTGSDSFAYKVNDGAADSPTTATVNLDVGGGVVTIGTVSFDTAESADLSAHSLAIPTDFPWPFIRYDGTQGGFGVLFTQATNRGVPVTRLTVTAGDGDGAVYDLARATDGAIYYLYAQEGGPGGPEVTPTEPLLFLPATLVIGTNWQEKLGQVLWGDVDPTPVQVTGQSVTSQAGFTNTTRIDYHYPDGVVSQYWRTGDGLLEMSNQADFRRVDRATFPPPPDVSTGFTLKTIEPGDTWTHILVGTSLDPDGNVDPAFSYAILRVTTVQDYTVTEPGGSRTARVAWVDSVAYLPGVGTIPSSQVQYFNQDGSGNLLEMTDEDRDWYTVPADGRLLVPGTIAFNGTWGGHYETAFFAGVFTNTVGPETQQVTTPAGIILTFPIEWSDHPELGLPQDYLDVGTNWFSPAVGNDIQSLGSSTLISGWQDLWAEQLVDYGTVPGAQDSDSDGVADISDNCPHVPNGAGQAGIPGVGNQTDTDGNGMGDACDPGTLKPLLKPGAGGTPGPWRHHR